VGNLPLDLTSFVNRRQEIQEITARLSSSRLVTLIGPPGVGKTRLALRVGALRERAFFDGVWLVQFARLREADLVAPTVATTLGLADAVGADAVGRLVPYLRERQILLILDNCEHLAAECAALAHTLLTRVPDVRMLATSRQALGVAGEHVWPVGPLPVAVSTPARNLVGWRRPDERASHAVALFAQRAAAVAPEFELGAGNRAEVAEICRRLDGIPLAIELAAARMRSLTATQLLARLDDRFRLLITEDPGALPHQRTLATTVDWSHELCNPAEQAMWARASVFAGEFDLEAAEQICVGGPITRADVADLLDRLVAKSIVVYRRPTPGAGAGYRLLETLRQYGLTKLHDTGAATHLMRAHADRHLRLAERAEREWFGPGQVGWFARLHRADADIRQALEHYLTTDDTESALRLAGALWFHWMFSGRTAEGELWLRRVLARPGGSPRARVWALSAAFYVASLRADLDAAAAHAQAAWVIAADLDDPLATARANGQLASVGLLRGEVDVDGPLAAALAGYEAAGESGSATGLICRLAQMLWLFSRGELAQAAQVCEQIAATCRARGEQVILASALNQLLYIDWRAGRTERAVGHGREILRAWRVGAPTMEPVQTMEMLAWVAADNGEYGRAAILLGAADRGWQMTGWRILMDAAPYRTSHAECVDTTRRALGETAFAAELRRGAELTFDDVLAFATGAPAQTPTGRTGRPDADGVLTRRQAEVAELVAQGLSNKEIAARLVISQRTAESHVDNMLSKLGFAKRSQIAAWVAGRRD
jgi:non-specific serine/threonine protein kinase